MNVVFMNPLKIYGVKLKDKNKIMKSQSGGAFAAIAEHLLRQGVIVYGCSLNKELMAVYSRISSTEELNWIKGSKYVQADLGDTLKSVLNDLESGKMVLFSGTPCYVAACRQYVDSKKYGERLYTVDVICHGVPSPAVYRKYLKEMSGKEGSCIQNYIFRDKTGRERIIYRNGKEEYAEDYIKLFYTNLMLRPSCGKCKFAKINRIADFTIGDFWGVQNSFPDFWDNNGVSIVFCNNERSIEIFNEIKNDFDILETDIEHAMQPNLKNPSKIPVYRKKFWRDFNKYGVLYCSKKWPLIVEFPSVLKTKIRRIVRNKIKLLNIIGISLSNKH